MLLLTDPQVAALVLTDFMTWFTTAFNALDQAQFMGISYLNISVAIATYEITEWGVKRILDSNKSDA